MILPDLKILELANTTAKYIGSDSPDLCVDRQWFDAWTKPISYLYNSRGFRDNEWPSELDQAVWCLGDSFTTGLGSAFEHTWPQVLSQQTNLPVVNVSLDGGSNEWISRRACEIYTAIQPKYVVIMWSYIHRREHPDINRSDLDRRLRQVFSTDQQDFDNLMACRNRVHAHCKKSFIVDLVIPDCWPRHFPEINLTQCGWDRMRGSQWPLLAPSNLSEFFQLPSDITKELQQIHNIDLQHSQRQFEILALQSMFVRVPKLDLARDGRHFDILTSQWVVDEIQQRLGL